MYLISPNNTLLSNTINNINIKNKHINNIEKNLDDKYNNINNNNNILENMEFSIKINNFNPKKNSDPNDWECRLIKRVSSFTLLSDMN